VHVRQKGGGGGGEKREKEFQTVYRRASATQSLEKQWGVRTREVQGGEKQTKSELVLERGGPKLGERPFPKSSRGYFKVE